MKRRPPHLRRATDAKTCHVCRSMNRRNGQCVKYHYPVTRTETCDKWAPRK